MSQSSALTYLEENHDRFQNELIELLRIPSISNDPAHKTDMDKAAGWLADERRVAAVGIDTASIDFGASHSFDTHQVLARSEVPAFENVARLDALPATGAFAVALPMKIRGGSGAPLRVVAIVPDRP